MEHTKLGQYFYARRRNHFGVYLCNCKEEGFMSGEFVQWFNTKEEAKNYVYKMNGWLS